MNALVDDLVESEMSTAAARAQYLGFAKNVRAGHQDEMEITGNAFSVRFTREGVYIESLWDERVAPRQIDLDGFIQALSAWPAR
jgi:hypothetical protein